jgi:hypothetical protein
MKISDFLSPADVTVDIHASNKGRLLRDLATKAAVTLNLSADNIATARGARVYGDRGWRCHSAREDQRDNETLWSPGEAEAAN